MHLEKLVILRLIFFFALAMITFTYLSCVQASELGNWKIGTFVDEFGDKTSDTYITIKTKFPAIYDKSH